MTTEVCKKCHGDGIIGNGPEPHLKQGDTRTCDVCTGTGKVEVVETQTAEAEEKKEEQVSESTGQEAQSDTANSEENVSDSVDSTSTE